MAIDTRGKEMRNIRKTLQPQDDENQIISDCEQKASAFFSPPPSGAIMFS